MDVGGKSMRTGALKPSTFKNPVGKKKGGEESYRLSRCQAARTRKGGMKGEGKTKTSERSCYILTVLEREAPTTYEYPDSDTRMPMVLKPPM
jgi:hypothetical protein